MYGADIFTETESSPITLAHLGPLAAMAGTWEGHQGIDEHPIAGGVEQNAYVEYYDLQPIDRQTNGPQLFYGLRYHTHVVKPGEVETFHDQVGYWLWEPATNTVILTVAIPRAQVLMASGVAQPDSTEFELTAHVGAERFGILSNPFLEEAFRTVSFKMAVKINPDGTWSYDEETVMELKDRKGPFQHTDRNTLRRVAAPIANPLAVELQSS